MSRQIREPVLVNGRLLSPHLIEAWQATILRIRSLVSAGRLWDRVLTDYERHQLGGEFEPAYQHYRGTAGMWMHLTGCNHARAVVDVAQRLHLLDEGTAHWFLRELGEPVTPEETRDQAIDAGDLVLVETPREAHWDGELIKINWDSRPASWNFLWKLACNGKTAAVIDAFTFRQGKHNGYVGKLKSKVIKLNGFPADLAGKIKSAGRGSYRLCLTADRIHVFECVNERLREWSAGGSGDDEFI